MLRTKDKKKTRVLSLYCVAEKGKSCAQKTKTTVASHIHVHTHTYTHTVYSEKAARVQASHTREKTLTREKNEGDKKVRLRNPHLASSVYLSLALVPSPRGSDQILGTALLYVVENSVRVRRCIIDPTIKRIGYIMNSCCVHGLSGARGPGLREVCFVSQGARISVGKSVFTRSPVLP